MKKAKSELNDWSRPEYKRSDLSVALDVVVNRRTVNSHVVSINLLVH